MAAVTAIATGQDVGGNSQAAPATADAGAPRDASDLRNGLGGNGLATSASASSASQQISDLVAAVSPAGQVQISVGQIGSGQTGLTGPALTPSGAGQPAELGAGRVLLAPARHRRCQPCRDRRCGHCGCGRCGSRCGHGTTGERLAGAAGAEQRPGLSGPLAGRSGRRQCVAGRDHYDHGWRNRWCIDHRPDGIGRRQWRQRARHIGSRRRRRRLRRCEQRNHRGHGPERCRSGEHGRRTERGFGWERRFPLGPSRPDHSPCGTSGRPCNWSCERF